MNNEKAQTAIEYLLIIGAAVLVVTIVTIFVSNALNTGTETGNESTLQYFCVTLDSNTLDCGCYLMDTNKGGATAEICCAKKQKLLNEKWKEASLCPQ